MPHFADEIPLPATGRVWHSQTAQEVVSILRVDPEQGLGAAEVIDRRLRHGPNALTQPPPPSLWRLFLAQFRSLLVLILVAAALLAGAVGDLHDAAVIAGVIFINSLLGLIQEHRAQAALTALRGMLAPQTRVRRNGTDQALAAAAVVPGDVLRLEAGDQIPADARVLCAHGVEVAEAALTGESVPVAKSHWPVAEDAPLAERSSLVFMGTVVTRGRLEAVVVATGMATEMGRLAGLLAQTHEAPTPLQVQLDRVGKRLAVLAAIGVTLVSGLGLVRGDALGATLMTAIALAVATIPEGLPAVVTITLALGMRRMARRHALVKKLAAVETLGCTTVICSDKTGTLTCDQMTVRRIWSGGIAYAVSGEGYDACGTITPHGAAEPQPPLASPVPPDLAILLQAGVLCSNSRLETGQVLGDPTEGALLALALKAGVTAESLRAVSPRLAEIPFDSSSKFMATFHREGEQVRMWVKGAPDVLLARATSCLAGRQALPLTPAQRATLEAENATLAAAAMRVLAVAGRLIPAAEFDPAGDLTLWAQDWTLVGLVGMLDPPRPEAAAAIQRCREAGIEVKVITGDHPLTAAAVATSLGLNGVVREGRSLDGLEPEARAALVAETAVFARVAPEHKMQIVEALQASGHVVAMTGDGVNDAPALKAADIGVAMGRSGTAVAREAATLVLTDDNFSSIVAAIREGRTLYENIMTFVCFQLSTNIGAILTVLAAPFLGFASPFTAIQLLWVNIIMDGPPALTLGLEPARPGVLRQPPRARQEAILSLRRLGRIGFSGLIMAVVTLIAYAWGQTAYGQAYGVTLAFTTFVLCQFFNLFNARAGENSALTRQFFRNRLLWLVLAIVAALQIVAVHWPPAQAIFETVPLDARDWGRALALAASVFLLEEGRKGLLRVLTLLRR
mgnify:CR=1 FL=1